MPPASEIAIHTHPDESARVRPRARTRWLKWFLIFLACMWLADAGISFAINHSHWRTALTSRLGAAFGRSVEVGSYRFTLWGGPALEAAPLTVGEDPRFGHEYFLRADSLLVRLRWLSLLRGRIVLGALSLARPSLNIVHNAAGDWNLAEWLPQSAAKPGANPAGKSAAPLLRRIDIHDGRINFKRGDEKLPVAFTGVSGTLETESPGRWHMDLEAAPWRAGVLLQQTGTLRLAGQVGRTSSRLLPARLDLSWADASLSDVLRLAHDDDMGFRGTLTLTVAAHTEATRWILDARAEVRQIHRWDLPSRSDNPAINLLAQAQLDLPAARLNLTQVLLEAPHSTVQALGSVSWNRPAGLKPRATAPASMQIASSTIAAEDLLTWLRAFHPGVADGVTARGWIDGSGRFEAGSQPATRWPLLVTSTLSTDGVELTTAPLRAPIRLSRAQFRYDGGAMALSPATLFIGSPASSLRIQFSAERAPHRSVTARLSGSIANVADLLTTASALGWNPSRGWQLAGPLACDLRWQDPQFPWRAWPAGSIELDGALFHAAFLNQPVEKIVARADLKPGDGHIALSSAQAFGTRWSGVFDRTNARDAEWQFALSARALSAADIDRWLNPRWRESFLGRLLPFFSPRPPASAAPENLHAAGRLSVAQFTLSPFVVHALQTDLRLDGRHIELSNATGDFYGGDIAASLDALLLSAPQYKLNLGFSRVDLAALTADSPGLADLFSGAASGQISFSARGATRADLLASLECRGAARISDAGLAALDLDASLRAASLRPGASLFPGASAMFTCGRGRIQFQELSLIGGGSEITGFGAVDYSRNLDLRLRRVTPGAGEPDLGPAAEEPARALSVTGTLDAPTFARLPLRPRPR